MEETLPAPISYIDSDTEYNDGVTVQLVATHPFSTTTVLWGLGKLETKPTNIKTYNNQPKPAAWQNLGGGMEENEVERFLRRFPDHQMAFLSEDEEFSPYDKNIVFGGLREFIDESGYRDIEVFPYTCRYRYDRDDRDDNVSIFDFRHRNGHRVKTLFGHVTSFDVRDIVEKDEIAKVRWFDVSIPLPKLFFDRIEFPLHPFFGHMRRLMITIHRAKRMSMFDDTPDYCREWVDITDKIHPSWGLIFPVYAGDPRFPENGFRLGRDNWYKLFYEMISRKMEFADADFIHDLFQVDIVEAKRREERVKARRDESDGSEASGFGEERLLNEYNTPSRGYGHDSTPTDVLLKQDEEYRMWMEKELRIGPTS